jgi:hypothetical protein
LAGQSSGPTCDVDTVTMLIDHVDHVCTLAADWSRESGDIEMR